MKFSYEEIPPRGQNLVNEQIFQLVPNFVKCKVSLLTVTDGHESFSHSSPDGSNGAFEQSQDDRVHLSGHFLRIRTLVARRAQGTPVSTRVRVQAGQRQGGEPNRRRARTGRRRGRRYHSRRVGRRGSQGRERTPAAATARGRAARRRSQGSCARGRGRRRQRRALVDGGQQLAQDAVQSQDVVRVWQQRHREQFVCNKEG